MRLRELGDARPIGNAKERFVGSGCILRSEWVNGECQMTPMRMINLISRCPPATVASRGAHSAVDWLPRFHRRRSCYCRCKATAAANYANDLLLISSLLTHENSVPLPSLSLFAFLPLRQRFAQLKAAVSPPRTSSVFFSSMEEAAAEAAARTKKTYRNASHFTILTANRTKCSQWDSCIKITILDHQIRRTTFFICIEYSFVL